MRCPNASWLVAQRTYLQARRQHHHRLLEHRPAHAPASDTQTIFCGLKVPDLPVSIGARPSSTHACSSAPCSMANSFRTVLCKAETHNSVRISCVLFRCPYDKHVSNSTSTTDGPRMMNVYKGRSGYQKVAASVFSTRARSITGGATGWNQDTLGQISKRCGMLLVMYQFDSKKF